MAAKKSKRDLDLEKIEEKPRPDTLAGFQDFIQSHNIHIHKNNNMDKSDEGKIQTFLENNYQRISKLSQLFQQKLSMLEKFDQTEKAINDLELENEVLTEKIIQKYMDTESLLNRSLAAIFDSYFKKIG